MHQHPREEHKPRDLLEAARAGNSISHYIPWTVGTEIISKDEGMWDPADIGHAVYSQIYKSRHPGLQMGQ